MSREAARQLTGTFMAGVFRRSLLKLGARFRDDLYGGAAIVMAVTTPIIIGGLAYGAEVGGWELTKRQVQNAADVAAYAAGTQVRSGEANDVAELAAETVAEASGYKGGADGLTLERPPSSAPLAADGTDPNGDNTYVYVTLTQTGQRTFTKFFGANGDVTFTSSALAKIESGRPACVLALHSSASGAISTGGSTNVNLSGCDIAANSISPTAITATGNGSSVTADCISAVGDVSVNNTYHLDCDAPIANGPKTADPYGSVPMPTASDCDLTYTAAQFTQNGNPSTPGSGQTNKTLCYSGSSWNFNRTVNLASNNTYVLFNTHATQTATFGTSGNRTVSGTNVNVILIGKWNVSFNGSTSLSLTARTTGTYKGLALVGDRANAVDIDISGNNVGKIVGAIYSPNSGSNVTYTGSSTAYSSGQCTQVIGGTVTFTGNSSMSTDCSNSGTTAIMAGQSIKIVG
jgi:Flp pilus assembly protein TadG